MDTLWNDVRFAVRSLAKSKLFTLGAVGSLALGLGSTTAAFSLMYAVAFRPLPFPNPERLVDVQEWSATKMCDRCSVGTSYPGFSDWRAETRSFESIAAYQELPFSVSDNGPAARVSGALASGELFDVLGVHASIGRPFSRSDDQLDAPPVVLLSDDLWQRRYGADRRILGTNIRVNGVPRTVVGVMPPGFKYPEFAQMWIPLAPEAHAGSRDDRDFNVVARLREGTTAAVADGEMKRIARSLEDRFPQSQREWTIRVRPLRDVVSGEEGSMFAVLLGVVGTVLLIVCANVAGLQLARGFARRHEIAIRFALGATRWRIVRALLVESIVLACIGGLLGAALSAWTTDLVVASIGREIPYWIRFGIDRTALAFAVALSLATGMLFGVLPALRVSSPTVYGTLKDGASSLVGGVHRSYLRGALVIFELALALMLLAAGGVLSKTFLRISGTDRNVDAKHVLTAGVEFLHTRYRDKTQVVAMSTQLVDRIGRIPGVLAASLSRSSFVSPFGLPSVKVRVAGVGELREGVSPQYSVAVTPGYFAARSLPIREGRNIVAGDRAGGAPVTLINERLARELWPAGSALGHQLRLGAADSLPWLTIVGVVADIVDARGEIANYAYVPLAQSPGTRLDLDVRVSGDAQSLTQAVRSAAATVDQDLPLLDLQTVEQASHDRFWPVELNALLVSGFAVLAVVLAAIGLYGVIAYNAVQRTREIGIRVALGAEPRHIVRLVGAQGARLIVGGLVVGIAASASVLRVLRSMLFGDSPLDVPVFAAVSLVLCGVSLLAMYLPARRAARIDPLDALRAE